LQSGDTEGNRDSKRRAPGNHIPCPRPDVLSNHFLWREGVDPASEHLATDCWRPWSCLQHACCSTPARPSWCGWMATGRVRVAYHLGWAMVQSRSSPAGEAVATTLGSLASLSGEPSGNQCRPRRSQLPLPSPCDRKPQFLPPEKQRGMEHPSASPNLKGGKHYQASNTSRHPTSIIGIAELDGTRDVSRRQMWPIAAMCFTLTVSDSTVRTKVGVREHEKNSEIGQGN